MHKLSESGMAFLADWEGIKLKPYLDQAGKPTIGIGHLLNAKEVESGKLLIGEDLIGWEQGITKQHAYDLLRQDLERFEEVVNDKMTGVELKQHQYDALVIYAFNIGVSAFKHSSSVPEMIRNKNEQGAMRIWRLWNKIRTKKIGGLAESRGLTRRREAEIQIYLKADYSASP